MSPVQSAPLLFFLWFVVRCVVTQTYTDASCNGDGIGNFQFDENVVGITSFTDGSPNFNPLVDLVISSAGGNDMEVPQVEGVAVAPGGCASPSTDCLYVMYAVTGDSNLYLGVLNENTDTVVEIGQMSDSTLPLNDIAFDCQGQLLAVATETRAMYSVDVDTAEITQVNDGTGLLPCAMFVDCVELLVYDFDEDLFLRISSENFDTNYIFCNGITAAAPCVNITDTDALCFDKDAQEGLSITGATYIGNGLMLIACEPQSGSNGRVVLMDTDGEIFDIDGAGNGEIDLQGATTAGSVLNLNADSDGWCSAATCFPSSSPTSDPSTAPSQNPSFSPVSASTDAPTTGATEVVTTQTVTTRTTADAATTAAPTLPGTTVASTLTTERSDSSSDSDSDSDSSSDSSSASLSESDSDSDDSESATSSGTADGDTARALAGAQKSAATLKIVNDDENDIVDDKESTYMITLNMSDKNGQIVWLALSGFFVVTCVMVFCMCGSKALQRRCPLFR